MLHWPELSGAFLEDHATLTWTHDKQHPYSVFKTLCNFMHQQDPIEQITPHEHINAVNQIQARPWWNLVNYNCNSHQILIFFSFLYFCRLQHCMSLYGTGLHSELWVMISIWVAHAYCSHMYSTNPCTIKYPKAMVANTTVLAGLICCVTPKN